MRNGDVRWRHRYATLLVVVALAPVVVCAAQTRLRDFRWVAPAEQAAKLNPLASRTDTAAGGAKLFRQRCATCHGDDGRGTAKAPNLALADVQQQSDGALFYKISSGNTHEGMPAFSFLPGLQRWQLVLHIRARVTADAADYIAMRISASPP